MQGLLHLIHRTHIEHDARIAMSNAIHLAEVVVLGRGDHELGGRVSRRIGQAGGHLAARIGPDTRFAVRADRATDDDIELASSKGIAVIGEDELDKMIEIYTVHTARPQVRAAVRRAIEQNRLASTPRSSSIAVAEPRSASRRMATTREEAARSRAAQELKAESMSEDEQELEQHARNVRGLNASTPFRHQRRPAATR